MTHCNRGGVGQRWTAMDASRKDSEACTLAVAEGATNQSEAMAKASGCIHPTLPSDSVQANGGGRRVAHEAATGTVVRVLYRDSAAQTEIVDEGGLVEAGRAGRVLDGAILGSAVSGGGSGVVVWRRGRAAARHDAGQVSTQQRSRRAKCFGRSVAAGRWLLGCLVAWLFGSGSFTQPQRGLSAVCPRSCICILNEAVCSRSVSPSAIHRPSPIAYRYCPGRDSQ
jgi:hypothetical protein